VFLSIPIAIAIIILLILIGLVIYFIKERTRLNRMHRFEEEGIDYEVENIEDIVETYMRMLEVFTFVREGARELDCAICLKDFEQGEQLMRIPNC
jgi:hypothetical protein